VDGDPMEGALLALALKSGQDEASARARFARLDAIPFDSRHRYMATLNAGLGGAGDGAQPVVYVKGAPERLLAMCDTAAGEDGVQPLDTAEWHRLVDELGADGQRVLGLACRTLPAGSREISPADLEQGLTLLGLVGLIDP